MDDLYYLDDGVYRAVDRGPALGYVTRTETNKKGDTREVVGTQQVATWVRLVKIGPRVHDRGARGARQKLDTNLTEETRDERI